MPESLWIAVCRASDVPEDGGACVLYRGMQIAIFHLASRGEWYAVQNRCPHWNELVLWRGMTGESNGEPKVACPMHKRSFSLRTGACLSQDVESIRTFPVRVDPDGSVWIEAPPEEVVVGERVRCTRRLAEPAA
jgi:NAD(P)H-dependent nitrite reductase small subunit